MFQSNYFRRIRIFVLLAILIQALIPVKGTVIAAGNGTYTFNNLVEGNLDGQDNWRETGDRQHQVSLGQGYDGTAAVIGASGDSHSTRVSRINDVNFGFLPVSNKDFYIIEFEMKHTFWGSQFGLGYDANDDGQLSGSEIGIGLQARGNGKWVTLFTSSSDTSYQISTLHPNNRYQIIIDRSANNGAGAASVWLKPLIDGEETEWTAAAGLQNINMNFDEEAGGNNPDNWDGMTIYTNGSGPQSLFDNFSFREVSLSDRSVAFANTDVGQTETRTITIDGQNLNDNLTVTLSGDYEFSDGGQTLQNIGASTTIDIVFRPTVAGERAGKLALQGDDMAAPVEIAFTGVGLTYKIAPLPDQNLQTVSVGYEWKETKPITVTRTSNGDITNLDVALSGANADDFVVTQPKDTTLNDWNTSETFAIAIKDGLGEGTYTADVTISGGKMNDETFTVTQVISPVFSVAYDANGAETGDVPLDGNEYQQGTAVRVNGNTGGLERTGYNFGGWNTEADGSGDTYRTGEYFAMGSEDVTLYAVWTEKTYAIEAIADQTFTVLPTGYAPEAQETKTITVIRAGDGDLTGLEAVLSGVNADDFAVTQLVYSTLNDENPSATFTIAIKDGRGEGTYTADVIVSGDQITDKTFTVKQVITSVFSVGYDGNGAQTGNVPIDGSPYKRLEAVEVAGNTGGLERTGYNFAGWNTEADGSGKTYEAGEYFAMGSEDVTLYAVWEEKTYAIEALEDQIFKALPAGYVADSQETKTITVTRAGDGDLSDLAVALSGTNAGDFTVSQMVYSTLNDAVPSTTFTIKANESLLAGTYTATVTISADRILNEDFSVTQVVYKPGTPAILSWEAGDGKATVHWQGVTNATGYKIFVSNVQGSYTNAPITVTDSVYNAEITELRNGITYYIIVRATVGGSESENSNEVSVTPRAAVHHDGGGSDIDSISVSDLKGSDVEVLVNGEVENAGTQTTTEVNGQSVTTVTIDENKLQHRLDQEDAGAVITIPVTTLSDVVIGELNGRMVKNMEARQAVVEIRTERATYTLPAQQINIDAISERFGANLALQDIMVKIEIAAPSSEMVRVVEAAANREGLTLVAPPLNFKVNAVYGDRMEEVSKFNAYVERTVAIPDGIDPNRITTGVVVDPDGTLWHVPTKITEIDGVYYAQINSLTNSTYSVVWNPLEFEDMANHWAQDAVNNMGSRMIVNGTGNGRFSPDRDVTRAEFAAIIVRGLGMKLEDGASIFKDVERTDWYSSAIQTAYEYRVINGFEDGTFRPNEKITREQAMVIISNIMKITGSIEKMDSANKTILPYEDAEEISAWALGGIVESVHAGIITGRSGHVLASKDFITRAEVAVIIERLLKKSELI